jgi:hypothetical protein
VLRDMGNWTLQTGPLRVCFCRRKVCIVFFFCIKFVVDVYTSILRNAWELITANITMYADHLR